jgi:hypothetical protein
MVRDLRSRRRAWSRRAGGAARGEGGPAAEAGRVYEDEVTSPVHERHEHRVTCHPRLRPHQQPRRRRCLRSLCLVCTIVGGRGQEQAVDEGALADIGPAHDGDARRAPLQLGGGGGGGGRFVLVTGGRRSGREGYERRDVRQDVADALVVRGRHVDGLADAHAVHVARVERRDAALALVGEQQRGAILLVYPPCELDVEWRNAAPCVDEEQHKISMLNAKSGLLKRLRKKIISPTAKL